MNQQTFAQRFPFYMDAQTCARTVELSKALHATLQRRRNSVRIAADVTKFAEGMKRASAVIVQFPGVSK